MAVKLPPLRQAIACLAALGLWLVVTALFVGFRPEHAVLALLLAAMFFLTLPGRRLALALLPFFIFGISYDWMNMVPNYTVNPVDTAGLYNTEKSLFGIATAAGVLTPNEYFAIHHCGVADVLAGVFYLCWVPLPIFFGLWLYFSGKRGAYLHFAVVFLLVNLIGFAIYYIHPAAPPWYVAMHGFEAVPGTPGSVAGLEGFGRITGWNVFDGLYARNSNVFAAMPSLHSAYTLVAFIYAVRAHSSGWWRWILGVVTAGIWATAVYTSHHYILDVLGGIACALAGFVLFEYALMRIPAVARFMDRYVQQIKD
jgi:hypothetical protein